MVFPQVAVQYTFFSRLQRLSDPPGLLEMYTVYCVCTADQKDDRLLTANSVPRVSQGHSDQA
jgi:hypothetical protein